MRYLTKFKVFLVIVLSILCICGTCFAGTDQFRAFMTWDYETPETTKNAVNSAVSYAVWTFQKLGYVNAGGENVFTKTNSKSEVLDGWIRPSLQNYGFYIYAHGSPESFAMRNGYPDTYISYSELSGYWHFAFIDSCSCYSTDSFARALHTVGYDDRASMGWFEDVYHVASAEWWSYFYPNAGHMNLRSAALAAADQCTNDTPIRMYGDKEWWGWAW